MANTLLEVCQDITDRIGLSKPSVIISDASGLAPQYLRMLIETAKDMTRRYDWQVLEREYIFNTVAGEVQISSLTTDIPDLKRIIEDTFINTSRGFEMKPIGRRANALVRLNPSVLPGYQYRISGNQLRIPGNTSSGEEVRFEYVSTFWVETALGERIARPTSDTDILLLDREALILGVKWRFKKENGLAYGEDFNDYEKNLQELAGSDVPRETLSLSASSGDGMIYPDYSIVVE